jgi:hypothetical protein
MRGSLKLAIAVCISILCHSLLFAAAVLFEVAPRLLKNAIPQTVRAHINGFSMVVVQAAIGSSITGSLEQTATDIPLALPDVLESPPLASMETAFGVDTTSQYYYQPEELTERPSVTKNTTSDELAEVAGLVPEEIVIALYINEIGRVDSVEIVRPILPDAIRNKVLEVFEKIEFQPAKIANVAVKSRMIIAVGLEEMDGLADSKVQ